MKGSPTMPVGAEVNIQLFKMNGRMIGEYIVDSVRHKLTDMTSAVDYAKHTLEYIGQHIIVVSVRSRAGLSQMHVEL